MEFRYTTGVASGPRSAPALEDRRESYNSSIGGAPHAMLERGRKGGEENAEVHVGGYRYGGFPSWV